MLLFFLSDYESPGRVRTIDAPVVSEHEKLGERWDDPVQLWHIKIHLSFRPENRKKTRGGVRENWNLSRLVGSTWMWRMVLLHFIVSVNGLNQQRNMAGFARFFRRSEKITPLSSVLKVIFIQVISIRYNQIILHMWGTTVHIINTTHVRYYIYTVDLHYKILYNTIYIHY